VGDSAVDPHGRFELGLYVLGVLNAHESEPVERHVAACDECRSEVDTLVDVVAALALFSAAERRQIVREFGIPLRADARARDRAPARSASARRRAPARPAAGRPQTAPGARRLRPGLRNRRTRGLLGIAGLAAVAIVLASILVALAVDGQGVRRPGDIAPAATAVDARTGASVSLRVTEHADHTVGIRATVTGLRDGTRYKLYAVTFDGGTRLVTAWTGSATPQDVIGELPVSAKDLSFFTITLMDDTPVVSAYLSRSTAPSPTG
jgi:anti-sigma factor RsiW